jgi:hypothetical protein
VAGSQASHPARQASGQMDKAAMCEIGEKKKTSHSPLAQGSYYERDDEQRYSKAWWTRTQRVNMVFEHPFRR